MGLAHGLDSDWCFAILDACTYPEGKMIPLLMLITVTATGSGPERETEHRFVCAKMQSSYTSFRLWPPLALDDSAAEGGSGSRASIIRSWIRRSRWLLRFLGTVPETGGGNVGFY